MPQPFGAGALITTHVEHIELGQHHGTRIRARVERRLLQLGYGNRRGFRLTLGRARPTSLHLTRGPKTATIPVPIPADPPLRAAARLFVLTALSLALPALAPAAGPRKLLTTNHGGTDGTD